jgi:predicted DsbA family dithiol-disulfide isomerase
VTDTIEIPVYYDFASTICYVTHRVMERRAAELEALGVALLWRPIDLARITGWPRGVEVEGPRRDNALRVAAEFGVPVHMPARWLDSRAAQALALELRGTPREAAWRERVWTAVFEEGRDIGEARELQRLTADLGLDLPVPADVDWLARLDGETRAAYEAGITGVPTFDLGGWFLCGLQDDETTHKLLQRFVQRRRQRAERGED